MKRVTVAREAHLTGEAVRTHGGQVCLTIAPGEDGFRFHRTDCGMTYPADLDHLVQVPNCTALGESGVPRVLFIEHVLSALVGLGYTDAEILIDGVEIPLLDGSALPLVQALNEASRTVLPGELEPILIERPVWHLTDGCTVGVLPADDWGLEYCFEHAHPMTPWDFVRLTAETDYATEVAPARTFATVEEIQALQAQGLIQGGSEDSLLIIYGDHFSTPLRLPHEFATHKALDLIGDLALVGRPVLGRFVAHRSGHAANQALAKLIASAD